MNEDVYACTDVRGVQMWVSVWRENDELSPALLGVIFVEKKSTKKGRKI